MGVGYCYVAERREGGLNLGEITVSLSEAGIQLTNPTNGVITRLNESGDQIGTSRIEIETLLKKCASFAFQWWFPHDVDVCCSYRRLAENLFVHAYSLDGKNREQRRILKKWASEYFTAQTIHGTPILVVFDHLQVAGNFDWDSFVTRGGTLPTVLPDLVGLANDLLPKPLSPV